MATNHGLPPMSRRSRQRLGMPIVQPFRSYCAGLLLPGARKSVEPMAARVQPGRVQAAHQSLHHFVAKADWSDDTMLATAQDGRQRVVDRIGLTEGNNGAIDHRGVSLLREVQAGFHPPRYAAFLNPPLPRFAHSSGTARSGRLSSTTPPCPRKATHSVGMARQYCGQLGKQDNCQIAVSPSAANDHASLPIAYRLYLPHEWADDPERRAQAGIPDDVVFQTKPQIALDQLRAALAAGIGAEVALADARDTAPTTDFATASLRLACPMSSASSPRRACGHPAWNRCRSSLGAGEAVRPRRSAATPGINRSQPSNWRWTCPRKPGAGSPSARGPTPSSPRALLPCASGPQHRDYQRSTTATRRVVPDRMAPRRTRADEIRPLHVARDHQPPRLGQHRQAALADRARLSRPRPWPRRGPRMARLSHHVTLCIAAHGFLLSERKAIPPLGQQDACPVEEPRLPDGYRPRGFPDPA